MRPMCNRVGSRRRTRGISTKADAGRRWIAGGVTLGVTPRRASAAVTRVKPEQALYGVFFVKGFRQRNASFLLHRFLCSISQPFLRPDAPFAHDGMERGDEMVALIGRSRRWRTVVL